MNLARVETRLAGVRRSRNNGRRVEVQHGPDEAGVAGSCCVGRGGPPAGRLHGPAGHGRPLAAMTTCLRGSLARWPCES